MVLDDGFCASNEEEAREIAVETLTEAIQKALECPGLPPRVRRVLSEFSAVEAIDADEESPAGPPAHYY